MAGRTSSMLRSFYSSVNSSNPTRLSNRSVVRSAYAFVNRDYLKNEFKPAQNLINTYPKRLSYSSLVGAPSLKANSIFPSASIHYCSTSSYRSFFSSSGGNVDKTKVSEVSAASSGSKIDVGDGGDVGINWVDKVNMAGSIEGQVVEMGLTRTVLLNTEKFPVLVPNSLFSSQVIVNKSRAEWRAMITKIPLKADDLDKIPEVSNDIKSMLKENPKVFLGKEAPYCFLSRVDTSCAELTIGYNLRRMSKDELYSTEEEILLQSVRIMKKHGASLGSNPMIQ